jgi:hypothetical protein
MSLRLKVSFRTHFETGGRGFEIHQGLRFTLFVDDVNLALLPQSYFSDQLQNNVKH